LEIAPASEGGLSSLLFKGAGQNFRKDKIQKMLFLMGMDDEKLKKKIQREVL
jgi:hypothetical protein